MISSGAEGVTPGDAQSEGALARAPNFAQRIRGRLHLKVRGRILGRRSWLLAGAILVLAVAAIWWATRKPASVQYVTQPASRGAIVRTVTATGTVNPVLTIIVGSYVSGVIQQLFCDFNTKVAQGQICAKIDPKPYQAIVDQDKANLANAKAQLNKDNAALAYAAAVDQRAVKLLSEDSISRDAAEDAKNTHTQALAQIELDQATIAQRQAELDAAQVNLGYTNITSPVDGTVVSRNVTVGQTVAASFQTPTLFLIATDLSKMQVDTNVSESDIGATKEGDAATFTVEAFPDRPFEGTVSQVRQAPQTIQNVVTYDVVVSVNNPDLILKPGMTATTKIVSARRDNVIRVPDPALRFKPSTVRAASASTAQVWVLRDGAPTPVAVTLGLDDDSYAEIVSGDLKEGDQVIVSEQATAANSGATQPRMLLR